MADIKKALREFIDAEKQKKAGEESERQRRNVEDRNAMIASIGADLAESLKPILAELPNSAKITAEQVKEALISSIQVNIPEMSTEKLEQSIEAAFSRIQIPEPKVTVNVPEVKVPPMPAINVPPMVMPDRFSVSMPDVDNKRPLPVLMMGVDGKPFQFSMGAGGGGKADFFTVKGIQNTIGVVSINPDGTSAGAGSSVSVSDIFSTVGTDVINPDGRIKVELPTGSSGLTDSELRATAVPVSQLSGASWSTSASIVSVSDIFSTTSASTVVNADNRVKVELPTTTIAVTQSGTWDEVGINDSGNSITVDVTDIFATTAASNVVNADNRVKVELPATAVTVSSITASTTAIIGDKRADEADGDSNPVKIGGVARTANPTAVAAGDRVSSTHDDLGRQVMRPLQVRDLTKTAYVTLTDSSEDTLLAGVAGSYLDLVEVVCANSSDAAQVVHLRAVTGGNIVTSIVIPAESTAGIANTLPYPQSETGNNWTAQNAGTDVSNTSIYITAKFSQEV